MKTGVRRQVVRFGASIAASLVLFCATVHAGKSDKRQAPETKRIEVKEVLHGVELVDPYRWLEDQQSPETRAWIDAQNAYTRSWLDDFPDRRWLETRLGELMKVDMIGMPTARNGRYFFTRRQADQDLAVLYMRQGLHGQDRVLVDPDTMSTDHSVSVNLRAVSRDGTLLVYGVRRGGQDEVSLRLLNVDTGAVMESFPKARYFGVSVLPDNSGLYYTRHGREGSRVYFHKRGTPVSADQLIFGQGYDPGKIIFSSLSEDGRYLLIHVLHGSAGPTEVYVQNRAQEGGLVTIIKDRDARSFGEIAGDRLFLFTDLDAPNKRVLVVDLTHPTANPAEWQEVIPEGDFPMTNFSLAGGQLFANYLENVVSKVKVFAPDGTFVREIAFPAMGSVSGINGTWDSDEAFFSFSSFHIPSTIYRYHVAQGSKEVWAKLDIPVDSENVMVKQVWYNSKDGTRVPMFLVHRKDLRLDGSNPTYLTGYGGFSVSLTPRFSATAALWVELGGVYAVPNLRGGGEFGEKWHRAGMLENKQNVFDDFIAAAEWLIDQGYTSPEKLAIAGGSNGGLLVGAALTQRPELFKAVICAVPLLDMIRYHKFLVARFWIPEYGSSDDPDQFKYLLAYSPYQHVKKGTKYPAVLFATGDSDTRVAPLHARKMTALLQWATGSDNPILLYYDTKTGHSGGKPVSQQIEDSVVRFSFLMSQLDMRAPVE
ncbi:MAG: S9 family peptidase [Calditrichaeota bacterium]|nr:MAG: S9 family peptidase [Calditrichota bacterium]